MRDRLLWLGAIAYAVLFTWLGALKYAAHRNLVDFGIFAQTASSAFGCFCNAVEGSHWAFHFSPILYVAGGALGLVHSPLMLVALQAAAGALAAPPIYGLVLRERGDVSLARLAALVVWLYPPLAGGVFGDFHENGFAPAAVAWTLYLFDAGQLRWAAFAALATLAVKEDQAIFLAIAGALGWWRFRGTTAGRYALAVAIVGIAVFAQYFLLVQPHAAAGTPAWRPERFYAWNAADVRAFWAHGLAARAGFVVLAFLPLLFLPFRSRMMWLAVAPLGEVLLSRMPTTFTLGTHYAGAWAGYVLAAFAFAVRRMEPHQRGALRWCVALCVLELLVADPLHPGLNLRAVQPRDAALDRYLHALPRGISVATQEEAYTHLALDDPLARPLPELASTPVDACFVLIDRAYPESARLQEYAGALTALTANRTYVLADRSGAIELYHRTSPCR